MNFRYKRNSVKKDVKKFQDDYLVNPFYIIAVTGFFNK